MDKVKITQQQADAIEHCRLEEFSNRVILRLALDERGNSELRDVLYRFAEEKFDALVSALYIGYEVEQTPEDKVREYFNEANKLRAIKSDNSLYNTPSQEYVKYASIVETVVHVLDILNIKIKGVNE